MLAWLPLQNGMLLEAPHLQRVTRSLFSYGTPLADSIVIPPRTHSGPLHPSAGSSTTPIDCLSSGSISSPVFLSWRTSLPEGQCIDSRIASFFTSGSSDSSIRLH